MERVKIFRPSSFCTAEIRRIAAEADTDYTIIYTRPSELRFVDFGLERLVQVADDTTAAMLRRGRCAMISISGECRCTGLRC